MLKEKNNWKNKKPKDRLCWFRFEPWIFCIHFLLVQRRKSRNSWLPSFYGCQSRQRGHQITISYSAIVTWDHTSKSRDLSRLTVFLKTVIEGEGRQTEDKRQLFCRSSAKLDFGFWLDAADQVGNFGQKIKWNHNFKFWWAALTPRAFFLCPSCTFSSTTTG